MSLVMFITAYHALRDVTSCVHGSTLAVLSAEAGTLVYLMAAFGAGHGNVGRSTLAIFFATNALMQAWLAVHSGPAASVIFGFHFAWAFMATRLLMLSIECRSGA